MDFYLHFSVHRYGVLHNEAQRHFKFYLQTPKSSLMLYVFFWVFPRRLIVVCRRFGTLYLFHLHRLDTSHPAYEGVTDRVFRNVGIQKSDAGEIPKRIHTRFKPRRKFEIKNSLMLSVVADYRNCFRKRKLVLIITNTVFFDR